MSLLNPHNPDCVTVEAGEAGSKCRSGPALEFLVSEHYLLRVCTFSRTKSARRRVSQWDRSMVSLVYFLSPFPLDSHRSLGAGVQLGWSSRERPQAAIITRNNKNKCFKVSQFRFFFLEERLEREKEMYGGGQRCVRLCSIIWCVMA